MKRLAPICTVTANATARYKGFKTNGLSAILAAAKKTSTNSVVLNTTRPHAASLQYIITGLSPGLQYFVTVATINIAGEGPASDASVIMTPPAVVAPHATDLHHWGANSHKVSTCVVSSHPY